MSELDRLAIIGRAMRLGALALATVVVLGGSSWLGMQHPANTVAMEVASGTVLNSTPLTDMYAHRADIRTNTPDLLVTTTGPLYPVISCRGCNNPRSVPNLNGYDPANGVMGTTPMVIHCCMDMRTCIVAPDPIPPGSIVYPDSICGDSQGRTGTVVLTPEAQAQMASWSITPNATTVQLNSPAQPCRCADTRS